ncbi:MAG: DUF2752 domain-containing protein [Planctomycetota bacterium]
MSPTTPIVEVPPIFTRGGPPVRMPKLDRFVALLVGGGALALLLVAATLTPSSDGTGTHTGLGLAKCGLLEASGVPCITCGYTTAFAHTVRANFVGAFFVQPGGLFTALVAAATAWVGLYEAFTARPAHRMLRLVSLKVWLTVLPTIFLGAWAWKIYLISTGKDGWD